MTSARSFAHFPNFRYRFFDTSRLLSDFPEHNLLRVSAGVAERGPAAVHGLQAGPASGYQSHIPKRRFPFRSHPHTAGHLQAQRELRVQKDEHGPAGHQIVFHLVGLEREYRR